MEQPIWYLLIIAIIGSLPATLTALATLVYAIKVRSSIQSGHDKIEAKVDGVKTEVDGKMTAMINAMKEIALSSSSPTTVIKDRRVP